MMKKTVPKTTKNEKTSKTDVFWSKTDVVEPNLHEFSR